MIFSRKILDFAYNLIDQYKKSPDDEYSYLINICVIPDIDLEEFAFHIYSDNPDFFAEATGPDNKEFEETMRPTLMEYLKDSVDKDNQIEFVKAWREGMVSYARDVMEYVLDEVLEQYNSDHDLVA